MRLPPDTPNLCGRTAAERSLDRVYNSQKKVLKEKKGISVNKNTSNLPFPEIYSKSEAKPVVSKTSVKDAIEVIGKHLKNDKKFEKSLVLLSKLFESHFSEHKLELLDTLLSATAHLQERVKESGTYSTSPVIIALKTIFNILKPFYTKFSDKSEEDQIQAELRRFMLLIGFSISLINETDSFIFNEHVKLLEDAFTNHVLVNANNDDKKAFAECLSTLFKFSKLSWAYPIVTSLFNKVYMKRSVFDSGDIDRIEKWQSSLKSFKAGGKDSIVTDIGVAPKGFKDARAEVIVTTHGSQIWANKQFGI